MSEYVGAAAHDDEAVVSAQLGREPRRPWDVECRCTYGYPTVLSVGPLLEDGTPFPTYFWLSCPWLIEAVSRVESDGGVAAWAERLSTDPEMASRMRAAGDAYRIARGSAGPSGPVEEQGFAGQSDVLATKCLHAHVAARIAGLDDPVGEGVLEHAGRECPDERCAAYRSDAGDAVSG